MEIIQTTSTPIKVSAQEAQRMRDQNLDQLLNGQIDPQTFKTKERRAWEISFAVEAADLATRQGRPQVGIAEFEVSCQCPGGNSKFVSRLNLSIVEIYTLHHMRLNNIAQTSPVSHNGTASSI